MTGADRVRLGCAVHLFGALVFFPLIGRLAPATLEEYATLELPA